MSGVTLTVFEDVAGENCLDIVGVIIYILPSSISDSWSSAYRVVRLKVKECDKRNLLVKIRRGCRENPLTSE